MAVFLLKGKFGSSHVPPPATGTVFADVPIGSFAADWIEELAALGITGGCGGRNYCPGNPVTRAQMAVFLLKSEHGRGLRAAELRRDLRRRAVPVAVCELGRAARRRRHHRRMRRRTTSVRTIRTSEGRWPFSWSRSSGWSSILLPEADVRLRAAPELSSGSVIDESLRWNKTRAVRDPRASRRRRHGRGLPRARLEARSRGGGQGPPRAPDVEPRRPRALRARSQGRRGPLPPEHPRDLRLRHARGRVLCGHGAPAGGDAARQARRVDGDAAPGRRLVPADREGPIGRSRQGCRASGPQARQRLRVQRRPREDPRLRPREADRFADREPHQCSHGNGPHRAGNGPGHDGLYVAGASPRAANRPPDGPLLFWRDPVRASLGPESLQARHRERHDRGDPARKSRPS